MSRLYTFGNVVSTNHSTSYSGNTIYTPGVPMPTTNPSLSGNRSIKVYGVTIGYMSGGSGNGSALYYQGVDTAGPFVFANSGGTAQIEIHHGSGTTFFGLDGSGRTTYDSADGEPFSGGGLAGSLTYAGPTTPPANLALTVKGRTATLTYQYPADDGGSAVVRYIAQYSVNGGPWEGTIADVSGVVVFPNLPPGNYQFRVYAVNDCDNSAAAVTGVVSLNSGGKVRVDGAWVDSTIKVRVAGQWRDALVKVRHDGAWHDAL